MAVAQDQQARASTEPSVRDRLLALARGLRPSFRGLVAYAIYQIVAIVLWAAPVFGDPAHRILGVGLGDSRIYEWALRWTPWALLHGHDPLWTDRIFAPTGVNLAWTTFIPGPALLMAPITWLFGTLVSYNVLMTVAPAVAAWAAYLMCNRVTRSFWPSLIGGYLFGFSTYMVGQMHGHLNLVLIFPVPLAVYLVVRRVEGSFGFASFVGLLTLTVIGLFSITVELFATATLFGVLAFAIAIASAGPDRGRVFRVGLEVALAYAIVAVLLLPFLVTAIHHAPSKHLRPTDRTSIDLLSPVIPREITVLGSQPTLLRITDRFATPTVLEDAGYLGIPLLVMIVLFAVTERRRRSTWGLIAFVVLSLVLAMGPVIHLAGRSIATGVDVLLTHVPLLLNATSQRFPAYTALAVGAIAALWLARTRGGVDGAVRWGLVLIGAAALLPVVESPPFYPTESLPTFISDGTYAQVLQPDEIVFPIVPTRGDELRWLEEADLSFRLPTAYLGPLPEGLPKERLYRGLAVQQPNPFVPSPDELIRWLRSTGVTSVLLDDTARERFEPLLMAAGLVPTYSGGGLSVWREPPGGAVPRVPPTVTVTGQQDEPGGVIGDFHVPTLGGANADWSDYEGRPLMLTVYTEACRCDAHLRALQAFHEANPDVGALAIDSFTGTARPTEVVDALGLTYDVGIDQLGRIAQSFDHPSALPFTVMFAPDGRVLRIEDGLLDPGALEGLYRTALAQESAPISHPG
jgi:hypothetical protein